ncbi:MAG TPA: FG-GAP-like repeat-containing protein [Pyrinomonadaceae bacterium]|jgi:uncharacterized delta-60 repeat protein
MRLNYLPDFIAGERAYFSSVVSTALVILLFSLSVFAAGPGDLDLTFGSGGLVPLEMGMSMRTSDTVLIQPDGKIVIAGTIPVQCFECYDFALVRLLPNGQLDASFGTNGVVTTDMRTSQAGFGRDRVNDAALQPDGKILVAGWSEFWYGAPFPGSNYALARYNPDGTLDATFDGDGKLVMPSFGWHNSIAAVAVKPDGEIVFAGNFGRCPDCINRERIDAVRLSAAGAFVGESRITQTDDVQAKEMLVQPDGKILVGGYALNPPSFGYVFTRLNADGNPDPTFGANGTGTAFIRGNVHLLESVLDFAIHGDGKIFAAGVTGGTYQTRDFEVFRLNANGALDSTFGAGGRVVTAVSGNYDNVGGLVVQPDGKVLVGGFGSSLGVVIVRYNPNGSLDPSFGRGGIASSPFAVVLADLALQADGRIVTTGGNITVARFLNSGQHRDYDFDGDGRDDISIFRPNSAAAAAEWYWLNSSTGQSSGIQFGISSDKPVPADFDGDGKTDVAVFRDGDWYRLNSSNNEFVGVHFGQTGDIPVASDYDGDSKTDLAVYRQGFWYILNSNDNSFRATQFGISTDKPIIGDFDGDGKTDLTVYRDGIWYGQKSRDGFFGVQFGIGSDKPVAGDYDGDGKTDPAVYRPADGVWYLLRSQAGFTGIQFGTATDKPVPADYDGDGKTDLGVYRDGDWYLLRSQQGFIATQFGTASDRPIPNAFVP